MAGGGITLLTTWRGLDGRIAPRSGLAAKNFVNTGAGVIDADYRGEVKVLLFNHSEKDFEGECHRWYNWILVLICFCSQGRGSSCAVSAGEGECFVECKI